MGIFRYRAPSRLNMMRPGLRWPNRPGSMLLDWRLSCAAKSGPWFWFRGEHHHHVMPGAGGLLRWNPGGTRRGGLADVDCRPHSPRR